MRRYQPLQGAGRKLFTGGKRVKKQFIKKIVHTALITVAMTFGSVIQANALVVDIIPVEAAISEAIASGVDQETAVMEAVRDAADAIFTSETANNPDFNLSRQDIATEILEMLGTATMANIEDDSLGGLVINIVPIEAAVVELTNSGVDEETAVTQVANEFAAKIYAEEKAKNPEFDVAQDVIAEKIEEMLWEMKIADIEALPATAAGGPAPVSIREATELVVNDENPASEI